jgi:phosphatidylinositol alpha-mannosyltransferase
MRVGLVSPYDYSAWGGVQEHIRHLARQLRGMGHEVGVLAPSSHKDEADPDFHRMGGVIPIPVNDSVARISVNPMLSHRVTQVLAEQRFDVLHYHEPLMPTLPLGVLRISEIANVGTFHAYAKANVGYSYGRGLLAPYLRKLHATVAVSPPAREYVRQYFPEVDPEVIPNGVDVDRFRPDLPPIRHFLDGRVNFLFVGRLEKRKGVVDLVRGYARVRSRIPRTRLIITGEGPMRHQIASVIRTERIEDNVVLLGRVPAEVLPRYHATADVFCATATGSESFGIVLVEAMAAALPVLCTDIPGYLSAVEAGVTALTVRPRSPEEIGEAMVRLASDEGLRRRLGVAGSRRARERFAWPVVAGRLLDVYARARLEMTREVGSGVHN